MSARHWTSSTAPASSTTARCCSPEARPSWSPTRTCAVSISARASSCRVGMSIGPRLDLRQSQSLVMTPQLQQAIRLLALSNLEIESFIAEELEKNPLLDSGGGDDEANAEVPEPESAREESGEPETLDMMVANGGGDPQLDLDPANENLHQDSAADRAGLEGGGLDGRLGLDGIASASGEGADFDSFAGESVSLHDHLLAQAGESL